MCFLASVFPNSPASIETLAFQLTLPGFEEELFKRGLLLVSLIKAFPSRTTALGVDWRFGAVVSCVLFGLTHAFSYADGAFNSSKSVDENDAFVISAASLDTNVASAVSCGVTGASCSPSSRRDNHVYRSRTFCQS